MKRNLITAFLVTILIGFAYLGFANITKTHHKLKTQDIQLQSKQADLELLEVKYKKLNVDLQNELNNKVQDQQKVNDLEKQKQDLQKQLDSAQSQLQAKAKTKADANTRLTAAASFSTPVAASGDDAFYKNFIYTHESGNDPTRVNSIGCRGIGQACPGTKLPCGADYACQDAYFTNYAISRYGSWANAYAFWLSHSWW